jgi:glycosyltransferase involved in cell wall biosynthesis
MEPIKQDALMERRPRLLFLSHRLPFPPHNGASIRTFNILKQLAQAFDITALCFDRDDPATRDLPLEARIAALEPYARIEVFPIPQEQSLVRLLLDHARSVLRGRPYTWYLHESPEYLARVRHHTSAGTDLVHLDSMDLVRALPEVQHLPVICTHHNVESDLLRRRAVAEPEPRRAYMRHQATLLEREERRAMKKMALNVAVSPADEAGLKRLVPGLRTAVVPNGVDVEEFRPQDMVTTGCVFVGGTSWFPNKDGLEWFAEVILPELRSREWNSTVTWVGRATREEISHFGSMPGLKLTGYVEDIRPYVHAASCFIVPLRVGGGTRLKVLDAWAMGKAMVSTRLGAEGLDARHGENILLADSPREFAEAMIRILRDQELRETLGGNARRTAERGYSWESIGAATRSLYLEAAQLVGDGRSG